jgi:hypothetical protein
MPIDFRDIQRQVKSWGEKAPERERQLNQSRKTALDRLHRLSGQEEDLKRRIERARQENPALRCAVPTQEALDAAVGLPELITRPVVLAADGSQINPDRHSAVEFCVVNVGAFSMRPKCPEPPQETIRSQLLDPQDLYTDRGLISEEIVALYRDLAERRFVLELARQIPPGGSSNGSPAGAPAGLPAGSPAGGTLSTPVVALTDGPLELYQEREARELPVFQKLFADYLDVLRDIARLEVIAAGYVDKPHADLVVRMLELSLVPDADLGKRSARPRGWTGVLDVDLFRSILEPGERSALFAIQSASAQRFTDELALHFFYLNVGRGGHPWLARVEVPAWMASSPAALSTLHAVLVDQCRMVGARPYPYALHRAHEVAVVSLAEKGELEQMLIQELHRRGLSVGELSSKQMLKQLHGRTRYPK